MNKKKFIWHSVIMFALLAIIICLLSIKVSDDENFKQVKNEKEFENVIDARNYQKGNLGLVVKKILTLPLSLEYRYYQYNTYDDFNFADEKIAVMDDSNITPKMAAGNNLKSMETAASMPDKMKTLDVDEADYSKTNIQVENVDEADRIKTDGKYIYTINNDKVQIVDANDPENLKFVKNLTMKNSAIPEDILLDKDKIVVIGREYESRRQSVTLIEIYENKDDYKLLKSYALLNSYYTSRMIDGRVVIITNGYINRDEKPMYKIDNEIKSFNYSNFYYNPKYIDSGVCYIASFNLDDLDNINVYGATTNVDAAYVSNDNIYIVNTYYSSNRDVNETGKKIIHLFGFKGIFGAFDFYDYDSYGDNTKIIKISLDKNNELKFDASVKLVGGTINQFSFDEKDGHLRIALDDCGDDRDESNVVILDDKLKVIGKLEHIAKGERIYASRFIGDKLYLVTYKNMDPLFVIDLSNEKEPKILGELKIPGYSTYLHPYDENHIIGIGIETKEYINRDEFGRVISEGATTVGMKMALFDVSDVENPKEVSHVLIGDDSTTSNVLKNHKALLFSKEKNIIAIPISMREKVDTINVFGDDINNLIESYSYGSEIRNNGFAIYNISLEGIKEKGNIYHENLKDRWYNPSYVPVRGLYVKDNIFTISNEYIKVNNINTLNEISKYNFN